MKLHFSGFPGLLQPRRLGAAAGLLLTAILLLAADNSYRQPPEIVRDALRALPTPVVSVSPQRDYAILMQPVRYPPIAEVAQPMLRLAGIRIDVHTNGMHLAPYYTSLVICRLSDGQEMKVALPRDPKLGAPVWSPDGTRFAFTNTLADGIELWHGTTATGATRRVLDRSAGVRINGVLPAQQREGMGPIAWMGDNRLLLVRLVPAGRGAPPEVRRSPRSACAGEHRQRWPRAYL